MDYSRGRGQIERVGRAREHAFAPARAASIAKGSGVLAKLDVACARADENPEVERQARSGEESTRSAGAGQGQGDQSQAEGRRRARPEVQREAARKEAEQAVRSQTE